MHSWLPLNCVKFAVHHVNGFLPVTMFSLILILPLFLLIYFLIVLYLWMAYLVA